MFKSQKYAFDETKRVLARNTLSNYPAFNETFKIYTDAIVFQLG